MLIIQSTSTAVSETSDQGYFPFHASLDYFSPVNNAVPTSLVGTVRLAKLVVVLR